MESVTLIIIQIKFYVHVHGEELFIVISLLKKKKITKLFVKFEDRKWMMKKEEEGNKI